MESHISRWLLGAVVLLAAAIDWRRRQIPNWLTLPAMAGGLSINCLAGVGFRSALFGMLAAVGVYFLCFAVGFRGAGDGKLMGAVGAFVGWPQVAIIMVLVALFGGVAALAIAWRQEVLRSLLRNFLRLLGDLVRLRWSAIRDRSDYRAPGALRMPHGPVIAAGTLVFLLFGVR
jgi:Flp pilus assembly protein protease CpaA